MCGVYCGSYRAPAPPPPRSPLPAHPAPLVLLLQGRLLAHI